MDAPTIRSPGAPPERHAARVVAEMCRWLARDQWRIHARLTERLRGKAVRLGNPKAQHRFVARLAKDPDLGLLAVQVQPGKRGRATMMFLSWMLVAPHTSAEIKEGDPIPDKPWLACHLDVMNLKDKAASFGRRIVTFTHHALQRLAERCGARTVDDLLEALREVAFWFFDNRPKDRSPTLYVPVAGAGVAVIVWTEAHYWLVKTVLPAAAESASDF
jgi:hypothetical protein